MRLINGKQHDIVLMTPEVQEHFENPYNYTKEICDQFANDYYKDIVTPGETLLDIGANVGLFSLHVHPYFNRIICVEPTPSHFEKLKLLMADIIHTDPPGKFQGIKQLRVEFENSALNSYTGETTFYWCGINTTMNSLQQRGDRNMQVPCITLEDLLKKYHLDSVDFTKIDIEGSEDAAITTDTLRPVADKLKKVFIELHPPTNEQQAKFQAIFESVGYKVERYVHDSLICTI